MQQRASSSGWKIVRVIRLSFANHLQQNHLAQTKRHGIWKWWFQSGCIFRSFLTYVGLLAFTHWLALKSLWNTHWVPFPLKQTHIHGAGPCSAVHGSPSCSTCWDPLMLCFSFLYFSPINERALRTPLRRPKMGSNNVRDSPRHVALHPSAKYSEIMNAQIMKSQASKMTSKN